MDEIDETRWLEANKAEQVNWDACFRNNEMDTLREISFRRYSGIMEIEHEQDLSGLRILDIGAGYTSILPLFKNYGKSAVVDPSYPYDEIVTYYFKHNITYICMTAEKFLKTNPSIRNFDEIWIYNVLKHVQNPDVILDNLAKRASKIRIAELTDDITDVAHPFIIKPDWLKEKLISISVAQSFHEEHRWFEQPPFGGMQLDAFGGVCVLK
jgi:2-polyprenyl-3-methyl-5-hydroxy-6-metoxy-1,4-benzoquinol methylase